MISRSLIEVASWRIVAEVCRRYPKRFIVLELHPGGGMYDCLTLVDKDRQVAYFNRVGSFHAFYRYDRSSECHESFDIWSAIVEAF